MALLTGVNVYFSIIGYKRLSGTSMACPHVAGAAALMISENKYLTSEEVKQNLKRMAVDDIDRTVSPIYIRCSSFSSRLYVTPKLWEN